VQNNSRGLAIQFTAVVVVYVEPPKGATYCFPDMTAVLPENITESYHW
jgi:hypothetical protein